MGAYTAQKKSKTDEYVAGKIKQIDKKDKKEKVKAEDF